MLKCEMGFMLRELKRGTFAEAPAHSNTELCLENINLILISSLTFQ